MRMAALVVTLGALLLPLAAAAQGTCVHQRQQTAAISCAEGHVWDGQANRRVPVDS